MAAGAGATAAGASAAPDYGRSTGSNGHGAHAAPSAPGGRIRSSPLARKIAETEGIDLATVEGSGPNGRIVRRDVEAFLSRRRQGRAEGRGPRRLPRPPPDPSARPDAIPHSRMRKTIAKRMLQAKQAAPEIHVTVDIRMDEVVALRERLNAQLSKQNVKLSVGDFITKAVAHGPPPAPRRQRHLGGRRHRPARCRSTSASPWRSRAA